MNSPSVLPLVKAYFRKHRRPIFLGVASLVIVDLIQLIIPRILKRVVDDLTLMQIDQTGLFRYGIALIVISVFVGLFRYGWRYYLIGVSRMVEEDLRNRLFEHLQTLSAGYFDRTRTGDLMAHATNDINSIRMATGMGMVALNDAVVMGTAAVTCMAVINLKLTLYVLIPMPLITFGTRIITKRLHRLYYEVQASFSDLTETVREQFAGIRIIKAYNRESGSAEILDAISRRYIRKNLSLMRIQGAFFPSMIFITNLGLAIVLYLGGRQTITGTITPGDFVAFISYLGLMTWPMMAMGWVINLIQRGKASLERVQKILDTLPEIRESENPESLHEFRGHLALSGVSFSYDESKRNQVLSHIDFSLAPGEMIGITGPPGSGKTTLLKLIPRLYDVDEGAISLDGKDIRDLNTADLRSRIGTVPQEPFLFSGSIRENITFGNPAISQSRFEAAVKGAVLEKTLSLMPEGAETIVGERGVMLSGGQKQRVALARALLSDYPILVLDDPISQVDMETGGIIIDTIRSLHGNKTILLVSHRISAIRFADRILVMEKGRIKDSGTHETLCKNGGYYADTFRLQEAEESGDPVNGR